MKSSQALAKKVLSQFEKKATGSCFTGFDGFIDEIISVVDKKNPLSFITSLKNFGKKIEGASNKSINFELVVNRVKLGGNAPIFTNALLKGDHSIIFAGTIGTASKIETPFKKMASLCKAVYPLGKSAKTEALEFLDGKLILGKMNTLNLITYEALIQAIPEKILIKIFNETDLFACFNWTMLPHLTSIWQKLIQNILPTMKTKKKMFVDLSDPTKRSDSDLLEAFETLPRFTKKFDVILGLNHREAEIACNLLNLPFSLKHLDKTIYSLFEKLKMTKLLIHAPHFAVLQDKNHYFYAKSFYIKKPKLLTGAGDNFNAGYCNALLYNLTDEEALYLALATASFYIAQGKSPSMRQLCMFLGKMRDVK